MFVRVLILALCALYVKAQTEFVSEPTTAAAHSHHPHHHSHPTKEPSEHETFTFVYEPITHHMLLLNGKNCYMFSLSADERVSVHTDAGIKTLELKLITMMGSGTVTVALKENINNHVTHSCGRHTTTYYNVTQ